MTTIDREIDQIKKIVEVEPAQCHTQARYESNELDKLFTALAKAQEEMEVAKTDAANPFFQSKYADLPSVVKASRPFLSKNGLSVMQITRLIDKNEVLLTRLCHASGQWIESHMLVKPKKDDIQTYGSTLTYLRRYAYSALVGVVASGDDDDGEVAMKPIREGSTSSRSVELISKPQLQMLSQELHGAPDWLDVVLKHYKIGKLSDMLAKDYTECINKIKEIRRAKEA